MLTGVAVPVADVPDEFTAYLSDRVHDRNGTLEVHLHFAARQRVLPVIQAGRFRLVRWGCRRDDSDLLPVTGWTRKTTVESGYWREMNAEPVTIPARMGLDQGIWFDITTGIEAIIVEDERGLDRVYPVCVPASHYYHIMTDSEWMSSLVGQEIG